MTKEIGDFARDQSEGGHERTDSSAPTDALITRIITLLTTTLAEQLGSMNLSEGELAYIAREVREGKKIPSIMDTIKWARRMNLDIAKISDIPDDVFDEEGRNAPSNHFVGLQPSEYRGPTYGPPGKTDPGEGEPTQVYGPGSNTNLSA